MFLRDTAAASSHGKEDEVPVQEHMWVLKVPCLTERTSVCMLRTAADGVYGFKPIRNSHLGLLR
jgi:hypothetical protein